MLKKRHNKSFKRHTMLFYFPFCFLGLIFRPMFRRKETKTIKYRTEIKTKSTHFLIFSRKEINRKPEQKLKQNSTFFFHYFGRKEIKTKIERKFEQKDRMEIETK